MNFSLHFWDLSSSLYEDEKGNIPLCGKENEHILARIKSSHVKAKRITEDFSRKVGWVVDEAVRIDANVIKLERLKNLMRNVGKLPKGFHDKLYLIQYRRVRHWIQWQAKKHGLVEFVNPKYSSFT